MTALNQFHISENDLDEMEPFLLAQSITEDGETQKQLFYSVKNSGYFVRITKVQDPSCTDKVWCTNKSNAVFIYNCVSSKTVNWN